MKSKFTLFLVLALLFFISNINAQDTKPMNKIPTTWAKTFGPNTFPSLPGENEKAVYHNPNTTTHVYHTAVGDLVVPPNVIPFPTTTATESEVTGDLMIGNQSTMYAEWNSYGPSFYGTGFCFSNNGGTSWSGNYNNMNPSNNGGDPGPFIWPTGSAYSGRLGTSDLNGAYNNCVGFYSIDNGATWTAPVNMQTNGSVDKNLSCVDDVPGSPYLGRAYTVWSNFALSSPAIVFAYSADGGATWTGYQTISPASDGSHYCQGCEPKVGPGGVVYVVWAYPMLGSPYTETAIGFAKSTNGGVTWTGQTNTAYTVTGIRGNLPSGVRINGFPRLAVDRFGGTYNGNIYVAAGEKNVAPATDAGDMCLGKSTNGGATWTHTRINQDAPGTGRMQMLGDICVDPAGGVNCSYYDQRNTTGNVCEFWMSRSITGGASWTDVVVSDHQFTPAAISGLAAGYQGDYTGIVAGNGKIWPFWMDNSSGHYQVWTVGISYGPPPTHDISAGPFLHLQSQFLINTTYAITSNFTNAGSNNETSIPITFWINGVLTNSTTRNLNVGQTDSVANNWMPTSAGSYQLKYICSLASDVNRSNDTVIANVQVLTSIPILPQPNCLAGTYTAISGTPGPTGDDAGINAPIGFTFNYKGTAYTNSWICTNGFIQLGSGGSTAYVNGLCGTTTLDAICGFWDDLNTANGGNIQYTTQGTAPNRIYIVQFTNVGYFSGTGNVTFQIRLYENTACGSASDRIDIIYGPAVNNAAATGSIGLNVTPGGSGNIISATPGATCGTTTFSTTTCNDAVPYNLAPGTLYSFTNCPLGISHNGTNVPTVYSLAQNYPNPFNPTTTISFGIPKAGQVKMVVYDVLGRVVTTLVNEHKDAGMYNVAFDASNYASGVYFYKLEAGDFTSIKKMVLVK